MGVQFNRKSREVLLQRFNQSLCVVGLKQARHILDANGVNAHIHQLFCIVHKIVGRVDRTGGIGNSHLHMAALFVGSLNGSL